MEGVRAVRHTEQACVCDEGSASGDGRVPRVSCAVCGCSDVRDLRVQSLRAPATAVLSAGLLMGRQRGLGLAPESGKHTEENRG